MRFRPAGVKREGTNCISVLGIGPSGWHPIDVGDVPWWGNDKERPRMSDTKSMKERIWKLGVRIAHTRLKANTVSRVRLLLLIGALLTLYLAFAYSQDWYVEKFATYDWARDLGY